MKFEIVLLVLAGLFFAGPLRADLPGAIAKVKPSVLLVGLYKSTNSPRFTLRGTGFVVADGNPGGSNLLITNAHVLPQPAQDDTESALVVQLQVGENGWQMRPAAVLEVDKLHDLALLRFEGPVAPALRLGDSGAVREGQAIAFMGFPIGGALGFSPVTHRGMVSSIAAAALPTATAQRLNEQTIRSLRGGNSFDIFQLDGTAYPGNSGGPLFDPDTGDVLGVVNMVFIKGTRESALTHPSGISYAIPSGFILQLLQRRQNN
ncbi:MAG: serine protease [Gammaproteobacteria bacterium]|uniref:S1 family peptidase n=1 Tax=Rhodoferax sp. TaxID=50421 RepID=UPI0017D66822|nr:serine protease [Rhodoferax sp.]MBU3897527.1 serine protease [Gammaproteobacteria bacterium]MBA3058034.1 trypsin-like peptidase domain-containing protein [Rhodoferax sp.]MBU3999358.1 serine protease [Gammaproteobacteria bacterium]MBU4018874.1 serine protease [Gammaproteobacteria bacterium]MBU4079829.1 serine protease [Gammaproteobacteria bacterium]